jgi:DNA-binding transcriptional regulator GbsR (MarR family)
MAKGNKDIKADRFKNVASKRVQKTLDSINSLAKCANKNNYYYTNEEVNKMLKAIKEKVKNLERCYSSNTNLTKETFEF